MTCTNEQIIQYDDDNYIIMRSIENYPIDNTIVISGEGDVEIDMCGELIVGISIKSVDKICSIKKDKEYVIVQIKKNIDYNFISSVDKISCGCSEVFIYRNERDEILQLVIYNKQSFLERLERLKLSNF